MCGVVEKGVLMTPTYVYVNFWLQLDIVQDLVKGYNYSYHKSVHMKPSEVSSENYFSSL